MLTVLSSSLIEDIHDRFYIEGNRGGSITAATKKSIVLFAKRACASFNINSNLTDGVFTETIKCDRYLKVTLKHFIYSNTQVKLVENASTIGDFEQLKAYFSDNTLGLEKEHLHSAFTIYIQTLKKFMGGSFVYEIKKLTDNQYRFVADCVQTSLSIEVIIEL